MQCVHVVNTLRELEIRVLGWLPTATRDEGGMLLRGHASTRVFSLTGPAAKIGHPRAIEHTDGPVPFGHYFGVWAGTRKGKGHFSARAGTTARPADPRAAGRVGIGVTSLGFVIGRGGPKLRNTLLFCFFFFPETIPSFP